MPDTKASADPSVAAANVADADSLLGLFASATGTNGRLSFANLKAYLLAGLAAFTATAKGLVPASGGGVTNFLRADGTWTATGPQNNFTATAAPASANDSSQGYSAGSAWMVPGTGDRWWCRDGALGAAQWVKGDVSDHPGYKLRPYLPFGHGAAAAGIANAANTIFMSYGVIKQRITVSQLGARITTLLAGGNFQLAVYKHGDGGPGTLVASTGSGSTSTVTHVNIPTTANVTLEPGAYWFAINQDNPTAVFMSLAFNGLSIMSLVGAISGEAIPVGTSNGSQTNGYSTPNAFGTWPSDLSGATLSPQGVGKQPMIQFTVVGAP